MVDNPGISLFQGGSINLENALQNQEEAEDIEDQKRQQEEIQNLLTVAMDDFNYEDRSSINSSANISIVESTMGSFNLKNKYKNAASEDELKVLYEVRMREVKSLKDELEKQRLVLGKERDNFAKKYLLAEANREKAEITLKQASEALVDKVEQVNAMTTELKILRDSFEGFKGKHVDVVHENATLKQINEDILQQMSMIEKGFTTNSVSDRMVAEQHNSEIQHLRSALESVKTRLDKKEQDEQELIQKMKRIIREKDEQMIENGGQLNALSEHLQSAQNQCRELIQVVEHLSGENERLKKNGNNISDSVRLLGLKDQADVIKALHVELDKSKESQKKHLAKFEQFQKQNSESVIECKNLKMQLLHTKNELDALKNQQKEKLAINSCIEDSVHKEQVKVLQDENNLLSDRIKQLFAEIDEFKKLEEASSALKERNDILESQIKVQIYSRSNSNSNDYNLIQLERDEIQHNFDTANTTIKHLREQILEYENRIENFEFKFKLGGNREVLIKELQEKAAQFEHYLKQQKESEKQMVSIGTNTEFFKENSVSMGHDQLVKEKYEADLIDKEIELRQELQKEFACKFDKYANDLQIKTNKSASNSSEETCRKCDFKDKKLIDMEKALQTSIRQLTKITEERTADRSAIGCLLQQWKENFDDIENQKQSMANKLIEADNKTNELEKLLQIRENGDSQLFDKVKQEVESAVQVYNKKILSDVSNMAQKQLKKVTDVHKKIDEITYATDKEIMDIERKFKSNVKSYCVKQKALKSKTKK